MKYIASVSFGKDSLAMLLILIDRGYKLDEVIFYDTGMEFQAIYDIRDRVKIMLETINIKYTELKPKVPFVEKMLNITVHKRNGETQKGYGVCGGKCRWGTSDKEKNIKRYLKNRYGKGNYREYIGIAIDEERFKTDITKCYPLRYWQMTEANCLEYCYSKGFYWEENGIRLYDILDRVSCWCCANKNKPELENMMKYLPEYFLKRIELLKQIKKNNKKGSIVVKQAKKEFEKMF